VLLGLLSGPLRRWVQACFDQKGGLADVQQFAKLIFTGDDQFLVHHRDFESLRCCRIDKPLGRPGFFVDGVWFAGAAYTLRLLASGGFLEK
jgi:hypothetical protein